MTKINRFRGEYEFLSNYYEINFEYQGFIYGSCESAYQGQKVNEPELFSRLRPHDSKKTARKMKTRDDWDKIKLAVMEEIVRAKFTQNHELAQKLTATGDSLIIEENNWHDTFWGVDNKTGEGENNLGKILMKIREEL